MTQPEQNENVPMKITEEATKRYMTDPALHARVEMAVRAMEQEHGIQFDGHDRSLATEAAACALVIAERTP